MAKSICISTIITLMIALCPCIASANLINNGSFEFGSFNKLLDRIYFDGFQSIESWIVVKNNVDVVGYWQAADGSECIDLSGIECGTIQQSFATEIGSIYHVSFSLAGNPDRNGFTDGPPYFEKAINVWYNPSEKESFTFNCEGKTASNMGWEEKSFDFIADRTITSLRFEAVYPGGYGPAIDNVCVEKVNPVPLPSAVVLLGAGLGRLGLYYRRKRTADN